MKCCCGVTALTGDIDVWCWPQVVSASSPTECGIEIAVSDLDGKDAHYETYSGARGVIEYALMQARIAGNPVPEVRYNHVELSNVWRADVEIHHRPAFLCSPVRNHRLKRWVQEHEQFGLCAVGIDKKALTSSEAPSSPLAYNACDSACECDSQTASQASSAPLSGDDEAKEKKSFGKKASLQSEKNTFPIPSNSFNAVYQLCHIYRHLFDEGVGLRQLLDYYFVLRTLHIEQGEFSGRTQSMAQWAEGMGVVVRSNEEIMHTLSRFGMKKFAGAVMWVLARVFDPQDDIKTKTIKTPEGSVSAAVSENSSNGSTGSPQRLDLSASATSTDSVAAPIQPSGKKQEINHSLGVNDWKQRWPWMICKPDEKEGKFLLSEIMQAGNFGKFDNRIKHNGSQFSHAIEKTKHNLRLLTHYPEEVLWEPFFRVYHWIWRKFSLWRY